MSDSLIIAGLVAVAIVVALILISFASREEKEAEGLEGYQPVFE